MLQHVLLESPLLLIPLLIVGLYVLVYVWARRRTKGSGWAVVVGFAAAAMLVIVQMAVVTDREQLIDTCNEMGDLVEAGRISALAQFIAPEFDEAGLDREGFLDRVDRARIDYAVSDIRLSNFEVEVDGSTATVRLAATCRVQAEGIIMDRQALRFELEFRRSGDQWQVTSVERLRSGLGAVGRLRDVLGQ